MILEIDGYEARCVNTGRDALRVLSTQSSDKTSNWRPDLILLDLRLPDMSGSEQVISTYPMKLQLSNDSV
jgi:CheY-like chemotaxis protein